MANGQVVRRVSVAMAAILIGSACGGGGTDTAAPSGPTEPTTTSSVPPPSTTRSEVVASSRPGSRSTPTSGSTSTPSSSPTTDPVAATSTVASTPASVSPTTGGTPVTTVAGGAPADPSAIYRGVLGALGDHDVMAPAVATPPAARSGVQPLTGLPGTVAERPAAVVKIDNGSAARPQTGLDVADLVVEEEVEGGITRFAAVFHSTDSVAGPVRSGRTTDLGVMLGLGSPVLLYSGANEVTDSLIRARSTIQNRNASRSSGYWRNRSRRAPSNLYTELGPHWASATGGPPPAQFAYRDPNVAATEGDAVTALTVSYRRNTASWTWDGQAWLRDQGGKPHTVASGARITAANVVVIETAKVDTGMVDSSGATVPEFVFVGTGRATVFTAGRRIEGVWTRPTLASVATLTTSSGSVIELTPGRTWIELVEGDAQMLQVFP